MMTQLRLLGMTAVLTILIWVSADSLVTEVGSVGVVFKAVPAANMLVQLDPAVDRCEVQVSGPRRVVETVQAHGVYTVGLPIDDRPTGEAVLPLDRRVLKRELAEHWSEFRKLAVVAVQPESLPIVVDHMTDVDVELVAKRLTLSYDGEPQLQRSSASLRIRESALRAFPTGQPLQLDVGADLERLLKDQPAGKKVTLRVSLDARRFGADAEITPGAVEVVVTVRAQRLTERVPTVPILVALSFASLNRPVQAVARDGMPLSLVTQTIVVTGFTEDVDRLVRGETRAYGLVQIKEDDLQQMGVLKLATPEFHLPKGVELAEEPQSIEFQLIPITETVIKP